MRMLGLIALVLAGDAIAQSEAVIAPPGNADLLVYRDVVAPLAFVVSVKVDGRKIATLANHSYVAVALPAGTHNVALSWPALAAQRGDSIDVDIDPTRAVYLKVTQTRSGYAHSLLVLGAKKLATGESDAARAEIARCCRYRSALP